MDHLCCEIALNWKLLCKFENWCKFSSRIKAKLYNSSHLQLDLPVCKNMALPVNPKLLQFQPCGKCVGRGGHLACFGDICWCDVVCTSHFTSDGKSAVNQSQACASLYEFWCNIFNVHIVCVLSVVWTSQCSCQPCVLCCVLSRFVCCVVYWAGLCAVLCIEQVCVLCCILSRFVCCVVYWAGLCLQVQGMLNW